MKLPVLLAATVLAFTSITSRAEVLVYRGTAKVTDLVERKKPYIRKAFLVTDPGTGSTQLVTYSKSNGIKTRDADELNDGQYFSGTFTTGAPLVEIYSFLREETNLGVLQKSIFLRGFQKSVQVSVNQGNPVNATRAKFLKGSIRFLVASLASRYTEHELNLELDKARTIAANVSGDNAAEAFADVVAFLEAQGFTE